MSPASHARPERLAKNEHVFRTVNENIAAAAERRDRSRGHQYEFMCECVRTDCAQFIRLTLDEYENVRARGDRFALVAGHEMPDVEEVIERNDRFWVVEKIDRGSEVADELYSGKRT